MCGSPARQDHGGGRPAQRGGLCGDDKAGEGRPRGRRAARVADAVGGPEPAIPPERLSTGHSSPLWVVARSHQRPADAGAAGVQGDRRAASPCAPMWAARAGGARGGGPGGCAAAGCGATRRQSELVVRCLEAVGRDYPATMGGAAAMRGAPTRPGRHEAIPAPHGGRRAARRSKIERGRIEVAAPAIQREQRLGEVRMACGWLA